MRVKKGLIIQRLGGTFVAYDNEASTLHELNETAHFILSRIEEGKGKRQLVKDMVGSFKVSHEEAERDLEAFLEELEKKDLIVKRK